MDLSAALAAQKREGEADPKALDRLARTYATVANIDANVGRLFAGLEALGLRDETLVIFLIPIGLAERGPRACDEEARRLLGRGRASSVFPAPVRAALAARTWEEACARSAEATGKRLSRQSFGILPRIREVDRVLRRDAELRERVRETHPELCFYVWNRRRPLAYGKKTVIGRAERLRLVASHFAVDFAALRRGIPAKLAGDDDILDALAALWTAERIAGGAAITLPARPSLDGFGLRMEIAV
jgi:predicted RNase H-like nuclease